VILLLKTVHFLTTPFYNSISPMSAALINVQRSHVSINNCNFSNNKGCKGGAIRPTLYSSMDISDCTFTLNSVYFSGGAIYAVSHVNVRTNFTKNNAFHHGGVIFSSHGTNFYISDSNFIGNSATLSNGGVLAMTNGTNFHIKRCKFLKNHSGQEEGVIHVDNKNS